MLYGASMKTLSWLLAQALLLPLAACATGVSGELAEDLGPDTEKDDGSRQLLIRDKVEWDGQAKQTTKVFTSPESFEAFFGKEAPAEVDWNEEWVVYYAAGTRSTGGYEANVLKVTLSASAKTITVSNETVTPGLSCAVTEAFTSPATLVTIKKRGPETTRFSSRHKDFTLACEAVCGADLAAQLEYGSRDAFLMSEGDEPFIPVSFPKAGAEVLTKERMLQLLKKSASTNIDEMNWAEWIGENTALEPDADDFTRDLAKQYEELRAMVELQLTDVKVFDVGFEDNGDGVRPLYIIGKTACGDLAGYKTIIVAT